jgi:hypothetical protein
MIAIPFPALLSVAAVQVRPLLVVALLVLVVPPKQRQIVQME